MAGIENMSEQGENPTGGILTVEQVQTVIQKLGQEFRSSLGEIVSNPRLLRDMQEQYQTEEAITRVAQGLDSIDQEALIKYRELKEQLKKQEEEEAQKKQKPPVKPSEPVLGIAKDAGEGLGPPPPPDLPAEGAPSPELPDGKETREKLPLKKVVDEIIRLEGLRATERYTDENLRLLDQRYADLTEYFEDMRGEDVVYLSGKLTTCIELQKALEDESLSDDQVIDRLLRFVEGLGENAEDPIITSTKRKIDVLRDLAYPSMDQRNILAGLEEQLDNLLDPKGRAIPDLRESITYLEGLRQAGTITEFQQKQLEDSKEALADYEEFPAVNRLLTKVRGLKPLRGNPADKADLRKTLEQILEQEKSFLQSDLYFMDEMDFENFINENLPRHEQAGDWLTELENKDKLVEEEAEKFEKFRDLPAFDEVLSSRNRAETTIKEAKRARRRAQRAEDNTGVQQADALLTQANGVFELAEARIERYLYRAKRLGFTNGVHREFAELYTKIRIPEFHYAGGAQRIAREHIQGKVDSWRRQETGGFYEVRRLDSDKFDGVVAWAAKLAGDRLEYELERSVNPYLPEGTGYKRGELNLERQKKLLDTEAKAQLLWQRNYAGYYTLKIDLESPYAERDLQTVIDQWAVFMYSGAIEKKPNTQLQELHKFNEQWVSLANDVYQKIFTKEKEENPKAKKWETTTPTDLASLEVAKLRQQYTYRVQVPIIAYFNDVDDAESMSQMEENLFSEIEANDIVRQGYGSLEGMVALILYLVENPPDPNSEVFKDAPDFSRVWFHPEGSRGHLSGENPKQRFLKTEVVERLIDYASKFRISDEVPGRKKQKERLDNELITLRTEMADLNGRIENAVDEYEKAELEIEKGELDIKIKKKLNQRKDLSQTIRKFNLGRIGLDQPKKDFEALYARFDSQSDLQLMDDEEREEQSIEHKIRTRQAWKLARDIIDMNEISSRGGPDIKVRNAELRILQDRVQDLKQQSMDLERWKKKNEYVFTPVNDDGEYDKDGGQHSYIPITEVPIEALNKQQKRILAEMKRIGSPEEVGKLADLQEDIEEAKAAVDLKLKQMRESGRSIENPDREDRLPIRMAYRVAQYAAFRAEKVWCEEADRISNNFKARAVVVRADTSIDGPTRQQRLRALKVDEARLMQKLGEDMIPAKWNMKKHWNEVGRPQEIRRLEHEIEAIKKSSGLDEPEKKKELERREKELKRLERMKPLDQRLNMTDVIEGVYKEALDRLLGARKTINGEDVYEQGLGFRATLDIPVAVGEGANRKVEWRPLTSDDELLKSYGDLVPGSIRALPAGTPLIAEDIDKLPEAGGCLMVYWATEQLYHNTLTSGNRVKKEKEKPGSGGILGRAIRILDPAFNRFYREDDPNYFRDDTVMQRAVHAAVEAQWQRHFDIRREIRERSIIGADIMKNKTPRPDDRYNSYKIVDGDAHNVLGWNLLEWGSEGPYVTKRISNNGEEILTKPDRRARRAPDLTGIYDPMQQEDYYTESMAEDSREFIAVVDTQSPLQRIREGDNLGFTDFIFLKLKGSRIKTGYEIRVALEGGPIEGGKLHVGLGYKDYRDADRLNQKIASLLRTRMKLMNLQREQSPQAAADELLAMAQTYDAELEELTSLYEDIDARLKMVLDGGAKDLGFSRFAQSPLSRRGVDSFLPTGIVNLKNGYWGIRTLSYSDNGTSRRAGGDFFEYNEEWRIDDRKGGEEYPGVHAIVTTLSRDQKMFDKRDSIRNVRKGRLVS